MCDVRRILRSNAGWGLYFFVMKNLGVVSSTLTDLSTKKSFSVTSQTKLCIKR